MEEKDTLLTVDEFATKIKEKYPEYKDVDNLTLANKIVEKYPEYKSKVSFEGTPEVKKKDSTQPVQTQPVQTQESPTQEGPLLGLGGVSERPTPSPSVGIGKGVFPAKSPVQDLKESIQDPLLKAQERATRQQLEPTSSQNLLRTEKFVPYTDEVLEDADYKEWKSNLPENLQQETDGYDLYGAYKAGMEPIEVAPGEYHLSSRDPKTGRILKSEDHDTFYESVIEDDKLGYVTYKSKDGNIYSKKQYEIDIAGDAQEIFRVDDTGAVVKESVVGEKEPVSKVEREASKRKLDFEVTRDQLLSVDVKDKLFDKDYTDGLLDVYAPKEITRKGATGGPGGVTMYEETVRDQKKVDLYQNALNEAKKEVLSEKLSNITGSGETVFQSAELSIDNAMNSWLETAKELETKEGRKDLTFLENLILDDEYIKKDVDISTVHDILKPGYVGGAQGILDSEIDKFVEENLEDLDIQSDEEKKMMKIHLKEVYKSKKKLDKAAGEVAKELGYEKEDVTKDFEKIEKEIKGYESEIQSLYTPYEAKSKQVQKDMTLEFEKIQDRVIDRISNSQEYKSLLSEYQGKVNSGELTAEEANSALSQKINIMLSESPEATQIKKKYQGILSSYESQFEKETSRIFSNMQSAIEQAKDLSSKEKEYRKMLSEKLSEMYENEQSEIEADWKSLYFGGGQVRGLKTGLGTIAAMTSGASDMMFGETEFSKSLTSVNNQIKSDNPLIDPGEFSWTESPFDPDWWATRVAPSAPLTFMLMAPGVGVGAGTAALATRVGLTGLSRALVAGTVSGTGMRAMESFTEASLQYYDLIERGESVEYASIEASKTYTDQMGAGVFDVAEMTFIFLPAASRLATIAKVAVQFPLNSAEELYQEEINAEEVAYNRYLKGELTQKEIAEGVSEYEKVFAGGKFSDMYNFLKTKQGQEVAAIGGIYGGAFGGASLPGDISRTNSLRRLNNFLNEEIVRYSSTEVVRNAEGKPLEFGMGGVVAGPAETMQEAKNRRIWQLKSTLDEMQMKGLINEDDAKLGKKQIDFAFGVADQMPVNLPLVTRGQLLQKLTEIRDLEEGLEGMTNETLIDAQKKKIAKLKKESEEIIGGTAQGYFINNVSVTKEQFAKIASNSKFAEGVINGEIDVTIMNDADTQKGFAEAIEEYKTGKEELKVLDRNERIEKALAILEPIASAREELTVEQLTEVSEVLGEELAGELISDQISKAPDAVELYNLLDDNKVKIDDTQVTEQEGVGTEEQRREEDAGQVQEPEVSEEEGATDTVLQEQEEVADATEEIVNDITTRVNQSKDDADTKRRKRTALRAVANILNFKSNILPDTKVKVHETDESYRAATGVDGPGVYDPKNDTIHINLAHKEAGDETVYHEMIHPIIYNAVKNETEARILTQRMVEGVVRSSGGNKAIVDKLKGWLEQYEASERPEETIAEVAGILASEFKNLGVSAKNIIMDYLNKMARKFGGKNLFRAVSKDADVVKVLNRLSEAMRAGEAITAEDLRSGEFEIKTGVERDVEQGTLVEGADGTIPEGIDDSKGSPIDLKLRMPKTLLDRGGINIEDVKRGSINDLSGANAFVFAADQATYGLVESPSGVEYRFFGGYLFPYGNEFAWAFTGEEGANKVVNKVNESDGIGLVMSQAPDGIKGSLAFWEYMYAEIENAISKGVSEEKILKYVNSKLQLAGIPDALKEKGIKTQIDRLDELKTLMPIEGKNRVSYEVRGSFTKSFFSATSFDEFGIPPLNKTAKVDLGVLDYVNDPSLKNVEYGDIISAIQFDKNAKPIRLSKDDPNYHPSYPVVLPGKPIMVFNNAVDVRDVYPNAVPKSKKASQVPLGQRKKPAAARSAMGGQYITEIQPGIKKGQPFGLRERKSSPLFSGKNEDIESIENNYIKNNGLEKPVDIEIRKLNTEYSKAMADVYEAAKHTPLDKEVQKAYKALASESKKQFEALLKAGYKVEMWDGKGEPYANSVEMVEDLRDNKHLYVFSTEEGFGETGITPQNRKENPMLADSGYKDVNGKKLLLNDLFRFVHDAFGHGKLGNSFGPVGEENAWYVHSQMFSPDARRAMTSETRGQNSWVNFGPQLRNKDGSLPKRGDKNYVPLSQRDFAPQKNFLFPDEYVFDKPNTQGRFDLKEDKAPAAKKPGVKQRKAAAPDQKVRASIDFQNRYGKYFTISRDFNNEKHLENYIDFMERKGNKEIGIERFPIGLKERKPLKFRKPKAKLALEASIDNNVKGAKEKETKSLRTDLKDARRKFIDFRGDIKDLTKAQKELEGVYERIITSLGSNGVAKLSFDKAYDQIYEGLGPKQRDALDKIIIARRIVAVNENRSVNNVDAIEDLFNNVPDFFKKKGGDYVTSFEQTMVDISNTVSNTPLEKDLIIQEALTLMSLMPVMNSIASNQNLTAKEILSEQNKVINELKKELESKLKAENVTFSDDKGNPHGLNAAYELLDAKRIELGDELYDKINKRADKYFDKFQEMLDQDLADGIVSQEQYDAMKGIDYSPRVFVQFIYGIDNEIINNTSEVDNVNGVLTSTFGLNKDAIRTLRDGVRNDDLDGVFFKMITNSEVLLGNYINSRERLRKMNDLNSYTLGQLTGLEARFNDLKSKQTLTKEERLELETLKETFDAFSTKRKKGYLPVNFYEEGVKKKFYIRGDLYSQWYNLRPDLSIKLDSVDKILNSPIGMLKTFATGVLSPLFGITASAIDLTQLMIFSDAKGFSEIMPVKAAQIAKDLVGVPFFQKGVIQSILQEDELFIEAVNEGIMMDFLYTQGNMNIIRSMLKTGIETALEKTELGFGGYVKSKKALLKIAEATLILNKMAELAPRLTAYQRTRDFEYAKVDKMLKDGSISKEEAEQMKKNARVKAAAIARELMNFAEGGEVTKGFVDRYSTYFNPAMQGTVTAARQTKENPIRTTSRAAQTAAMFSGMVLGVGYMLTAMLKADDDDKEINEIIKETRDNASDYVKEKYFLIPTGKKDEDGNYLSIRLKKHPQMVPFYELFEIGYDNYLNGGDSTSVLSSENALRISHAFFDNALPMNISPVDKEGNFRGKTILSEPFQRNPLLGGGLELITGYDLYRNKMIEPQTFNSKNADQAVKGLLNPYTEDFYKSFALEMQDKAGASLSPAEYKHFVERMITNPRNNFYVAAGYAMLNQVSDLDVNKKDKTFFDDTYSMISKKLIYASTSKKGISKTKKSKFMDRYKANNNKTYLIRESARKAVDEVVKEGGLMKIANDEERKGMIKEAFDKFKKNLDVVAETYPEMNMDVDLTLKEYGEYFKNRVVLEALPVDELNLRKYQQILSEPHGMNKSENQALLFAAEFTKDGVMVNPRSEEFLIILEELEKTANNSNKKFNTADFIIEYAMIYNEENGVVSNSSKINEAYRQYRLRK